jgi:hypothetical protein
VGHVLLEVDTSTVHKLHETGALLCPVITAMNPRLLHRSHLHHLSCEPLDVVLRSQFGLSLCLSSQKLGRPDAEWGFINRWHVFCAFPTSNYDSMNSDLLAFQLRVTLVHLPSSISRSHRDVTLMTMRSLGLGNDVLGLGFMGLKGSCWDFFAVDHTII